MGFFSIISSSEIASNTSLQHSIFVRMAPLALKQMAMKIASSFYGEKLGSVNISNLGVVECPLSVSDLIERIEFIIGTQKSYPTNCAVCTFKGKTYINMIRWSREPGLERMFLSRLVRLGIPVSVESNEQGGTDR